MISEEEFSEFSHENKEFYELNESIISSVNILKSEPPQETKEFEISNLEFSKERVLELIDYITKYLADRFPDQWVFELDKEALKIMLSNIEKLETESIVYILKRKQAIQIECFPVKLEGGYGLKFYCTMCERWHTHGIGEGHRLSHCHGEIWRGGELVKRKTPLSSDDGYYVKMMSKDALRTIRDEINAYLGE